MADNARVKPVRPAIATVDAARRRYAALRKGGDVAAALCVLQLDAEASVLAVGHAGEPDEVLTLELGSARTSREHFKRSLPTALELETAIAAVEDALTPARNVRDHAATLYGSGPLLREVARYAGVPLPGAVTLFAVEQAFDRLAAVALGRPPASLGLPENAEFAATLLIVRELMHHLGFAACIVDDQ